MSSAFDDFLENIGRYPLLTATEEIELARLIQAWMPLRGKKSLTKSEQRVARIGRKAYDRFFCANLRLVVFAAKKHIVKVQHMSIDDLVQEGCMGLARSIEKFDPERGYKFSTYAYWWIRQAISRAIEAYDRMIKLPVAGVHTLAKLRVFSLDFYREHGRYPNKEECIEHCDVSAYLFNAYISHAKGTTSLNRRVNGTDQGSEVLDIVVDQNRSVQETIESRLLQEDLSKWLLTLSEDELDLLNMRYGLDGKPPKSLQDIGQTMFVSREAVRHREVATIKKLRMQAQLN